MAIYYIADTHFGHGNIIRLSNRPFSNVDEMNEIMIRNWNNCVGKDDTVYIVGDFAFKSAEHPVGILSQLNGHKVLIKGNHGGKNLKDPAFRKQFDEICDRKTIYDNNRMVVIDHFPIIEWDGFFRGSYLVYGHIHNNTSNFAYKCMKELDNALNAGVDINNFMPVTLDELIVNNKIFKSKNL